MHSLLTLIAITISLSGCTTFEMSLREISGITSRNSNAYEEDYYSQSYSDSIDSKASSIERLAYLEARLSEDEFEIYQSNNHIFRSNQERVEYLKSSPSERASFLRRRGNNISVSRFPPSVQDAINRRDIIYGMSKEAVMKSWGEPSQVEVAGRGGYERWTYYTNPALKSGRRFLYFEQDTLAGWESF